MITWVLLTLSSIAAVLLFVRTVIVINRHGFTSVHITDLDKPSVSVCIAARNETHALAQCLERVLKSDYPKLEILVLDDSSSDDTPLIIKSFASAGVRFIAGKPLPADWLGKNHAYQTLVDEASGDYVLFLDVDTSMKIMTITKLVAAMRSSGASMLSVLPRREDTHHLSAVLGTFRYYWELLLGTHSSPPASSALWIAERPVLDQPNIGLRHYGMSVRPERHLARQLQRTAKYRYIIGTQSLGVGFEKRLKSQWETATRLYYPMSGKSVIKWLLAALYLILLIAPIFVILSWQWSQFTLIWSAVVLLVVSSSIGLYVRLTHARIAREFRMLAWPVLIVQEICLLIASHVHYRFGTVTWKGRAVHAQPTNHDDLRVNE